MVNPHYQHHVADLVLKERPGIVVETGLETGLGAEYILSALDRNGMGKLWSIDPVKHNEFASNPIVHPRFTFIHKRSQDALESLFVEIGDFDFFIHDSDHGYECQKFEYEAAWNFVRTGGLIISDDYTWGSPAHGAWDQFLQRHNVKERHNIGNAQWIRKT